MEPAHTHERATSSPSSFPPPSSSSSVDYLQAAPKKHEDNVDNDRGLNPKVAAAASPSGFTELDVGNGLLHTLENDYGSDLRAYDGRHAPAVSPTGSLLSTSYADDDFLPAGSTSRTDQLQPSGLSGELSLENESETHSPPTQVMERPGASPYRIPDYVFARKPSTAPMEWSTASNESLFSIQMGNMSFTREQIAFLAKSGELGLPGEMNMSGPYIDFSSNQPPDKQVEISQYGGGSLDMDEGPNPRVTEAKAVETMRELIMECADNKSSTSPSPPVEVHTRGSPSSSVHHQSKGSMTSPRVQTHSVSPSLADNKFLNSACLSHASDGSTKSFAFPILAGTEDRSGSLRVEGKQRYSSAATPQPRSLRESRPNTPTKESSSSPTVAAAPQPSKSAPALFKHKWLSCFSCCSCHFC